MSTSPFPSRSRPAVAFAAAALLVAALPAQAASASWERSQADGTTSATATNDAGATLAFHCGDPSVAQENAEVRRGQYMQVGLPATGQPVEPGTREIEIVVDGQIFLVPITFAQDGETPTAEWSPSDDWTVSQMKTLVDAMQIGDEIVFDENGVNAAFGLEGAEGALEDIFECD